MKLYNLTICIIFFAVVFNCRFYFFKGGGGGIAKKQQ